VTGGRARWDAWLERIAEALEGLRAPDPVADLADGVDAFVWTAVPPGFHPVGTVAALPLSLLRGIDQARATLLENTRRFADGLPANNALLWGARGMGKSALVKAVHAEINRARPAGERVALVEIHREDVAGLSVLLRLLRPRPRRFLLFCDDLSFEGHDPRYKSLKPVLEGGIEGRPGNVVFYATSNRRHLMPREMTENERSSAIHPSEAVEENVSLSDRFGLWLGFHACSQEDYLAMVDGYAAHWQIASATLHADALAWAAARGSRSGRVAWQFMQDLAGRLGKTTV
jgi:hypothetical protein